jgi:hypothetical protein
MKDEGASVDLYLQHQVGVSLYAKGEAQLALNYLDDLQVDIINKLSNSAALKTMTKDRLVGELAAVNNQIQEAYKAVGKNYSESQSEFVLAESGWQKDAITALSEGDVPVISIADIARVNPLDKFQGKPFAKHMGVIAARDSKRVKSVILSGVALGQSNAEIAQSIPASLGLGKRDVKTLVRTGIQSNAAAVRDSYFEANRDIIKSILWSAALDGKTTPHICAPRDGARYTIDKQPIDHDLPWIGGPPAHFNCRSASIPIFTDGDREGRRVGRNFNLESNSKTSTTIRVKMTEKGTVLNVMEKGARAKYQKRMGLGQTFKSKVDFQEWLTRQPKWFQENYLGAKKARLFREGGLPLKKFSEKAGNPLTLAELKSTYPKQWKKAFGSTANAQAATGNTASAVTASIPKPIPKPKPKPPTAPVTPKPVTPKPAPPTSAAATIPAKPRRLELVPDLPTPPVLPQPKPEANGLDMSSMNKIGGQTGSNAGGLYQDSVTGKKYYIKQMDKDHAVNEVIGARLYKAAGVHVPRVSLLEKNGTYNVVSEFVDGLETNATKLINSEVSGVNDNFAVDAWMANWDTVGLNFDNMLIDGKEAFRLDTGGTLKFRAQGAPKGDLFGDVVNEFDTLINPKINPQSSKVFGNLTDDDLLAGYTKVENLKEAEIIDIIMKYGGDNELMGTMIARRKDIIARKNKLIDKMQKDSKPTPTTGDFDNLLDELPSTAVEYNDFANLLDVELKKLAIDPNSDEFNNAASAVFELILGNNEANAIDAISQLNIAAKSVKVLDNDNAFDYLKLELPATDVEYTSFNSKLEDLLWSMTSKSTTDEFADALDAIEDVQQVNSVAKAEKAIKSLNIVAKSMEGDIDFDMPITSSDFTDLAINLTNKLYQMKFPQGDLIFADANKAIAKLLNDYSQTNAKDAIAKFNVANKANPNAPVTANVSLELSSVDYNNLYDNLIDELFLLQKIENQQIKSNPLVVEAIKEFEISIGNLNKSKTKVDGLNAQKALESVKFAKSKKPDGDFTLSDEDIKNANFSAKWMKIYASSDEVLEAESIDFFTDQSKKTYNAAHSVFIKDPTFINKQDLDNSYKDLLAAVEKFEKNKKSIAASLEAQKVAEAAAVQKLKDADALLYKSLFDDANPKEMPQELPKTPKELSVSAQAKKAASQKARRLKKLGLVEKTKKGEKVKGISTLTALSKKDRVVGNRKKITQRLKDDMDFGSNITRNSGSFRNDESLARKFDFYFNDRFEDDKDFMRLLRVLGREITGNREPVGSSPAEFARGVSIGWNGNSADPMAQVLHYAIDKEFNLVGAFDFNMERLNRYDQIDNIFTNDPALLDAAKRFVRAYYNNTQARLTELDFDYTYANRAIGNVPIEVIIDEMELPENALRYTESQIAAVRLGIPVSVDLKISSNSISSWATDVRSAMFFATSGDRQPRNKRDLLMFNRVEKEDVFSIPSTGAGVTGESEMVLFGGNHRTSATVHLSVGDLDPAYKRQTDINTPMIRNHMNESITLGTQVFGGGSPADLVRWLNWVYKNDQIDERASDRAGQIINNEYAKNVIADILRDEGL